jgi:hypothetical protein
MKSWISQRLREFRSALQDAQRDHPQEWKENELGDVGSMAPEPKGASPEEVMLVGSKHDSIDPNFLDFLAECSAYPLVGLGSDDTMRILEPGSIDHLRIRAPKILARWNSGPAKPVTTPPLLPLDRQDPNDFDPRELINALVLAAGDHKCDPALLWLPAPRAEYWYLASWEGCWRFPNVREAFDYLLDHAVEGIRGSLV